MGLAESFLIPKRRGLRSRYINRSDSDLDLRRHDRPGRFTNLPNFPLWKEARANKKLCSHLRKLTENCKRCLFNNFVIALIRVYFFVFLLSLLYLISLRSSFAVKGFAKRKFSGGSVRRKGFYLFFLRLVWRTDAPWISETPWSRWPNSTWDNLIIYNQDNHILITTFLLFKLRFGVQFAPK